MQGFRDRKKWTCNSGVNLIAFIFLFTIFGSFGTTAHATQKRRYLMGTTRTISSMYPACVAAATIINKYTNLDVTTVVTGASLDNLQRLRTGDIGLGMCITNDGAAMSYGGFGKFHKPDKNLRFYFIYLMNICHITVRADSGVNTLQQLTGRRFHAGMIGAGYTYNTKAIFKALGIHPDYFVGSLADAVAALKDNRIIGYARTGGGIGAIDATTMDIMTKTKLKILSFSDAQMKIALKARPGLFLAREPAGSIKGFYKNAPAVTSFANGLSFYSEKSVPQEDGYQIMKAIVEHYKDIVAALPMARHIDPVKDTIKYGLETAKMVGLPLHAGAVQYLEEIGVKVPAILIPPEYKKKS